MKNVLLVVHDDVGQEARYQAALDVVRAVKGHLTCLDIAQAPELIGDSYGLAAILLDQEQQREASNRGRLEKRLAPEALPHNWVEATGKFSNCITDAANLADLIVVNRRLDSFPVPDMRGIAAETLIKMGTPLLAVPETSRGIRLHGRAMIAWDGSAEASSALREAVPLLKLAGKVSIVEVDDGSLSIPGEEAVTYLAWHGIVAALRPRHRALGNAANEILKLVEMARPDYLVMGAFGHGRLHEAVFGGVTRRMLTDSPVPLLLAH